MHDLPCVEYGFNQPPKNVIVEDPVTVYGPMSKQEALDRVENFNKYLPDEDRPEYRPVTNAPDCLKQRNLDKTLGHCTPDKRRTLVNVPSTI